MSKIDIETKETKNGWEFLVTVSDHKSETKHKVVMTKSFYEEAKKKLSPEELVKKSFEFLLEREPKESILSSFDITQISRYFPEYGEKVLSRKI